MSKTNKNDLKIKDPAAYAEAKMLYESLRSERDAQNSKNWQGFLSGKVSVPGRHLAPSDLQGIKIMEKIAKNASFDEFVTFVTDKEVPAIKLTSAEMEFIKGGWKALLFSDYCAIVCVVGGVILAT